MWRAFFMAIGFSLCLLGGECLVVDHYVMANESAIDVDDPLAVTAYDWDDMVSDYGMPDSPRRKLYPPDWAPWGLLAVGVILVLYTVSGGG